MGGKEVSEPGLSRKLPRVEMFTLPSRLTIKLPMRPYRGVRGSGGGSCCNKVRKTSHSTRNYFIIVNFINIIMKFHNFHATPNIIDEIKPGRMKCVGN
jgi:hypothetical protein